MSWWSSKHRAVAPYHNAGPMRGMPFCSKCSSPPTLTPTQPFQLSTRCSSAHASQARLAQSPFLGCCGGARLWPRWAYTSSPPFCLTSFMMMNNARPNPTCQMLRIPSFLSPKPSFFILPVADAGEGRHPWLGQHLSACHRPVSHLPSQRSPSSPRSAPGILLSPFCPQPI